MNDYIVKSYLLPGEPLTTDVDLDEGIPKKSKLYKKIHETEQEEIPDTTKYAGEIIFGSEIYKYKLTWNKPSTRSLSDFLDLI